MTVGRPKFNTILRDEDLSWSAQKSDGTMIPIDGVPHGGKGCCVGVLQSRVFQPLTEDSAWYVANCVYYRNVSCCKTAAEKYMAGRWFSMYTKSVHIVLGVLTPENLLWAQAMYREAPTTAFGRPGPWRAVVGPQLLAGTTE